MPEFTEGTWIVHKEMAKELDNIHKFLLKAIIEGDPGYLATVERKTAVEQILNRIDGVAATGKDGG